MTLLGRRRERRIARRLNRVRAEIGRVEDELAVSSAQLQAARDDEEESHVALLLSEQRVDARRFDWDVRQRERLEASIADLRSRLATLQRLELNLVKELEQLP